MSRNKFKVFLHIHVQKTAGTSIFSKFMVRSPSTSQFVHWNYRDKKASPKKNLFINNINQQAGVDQYNILL